jgi:DNA polymerase III delta prime subunit
MSDTQSQGTTWRMALQQRLDEGHAKTIPHHLAELRNAFVQRFPPDSLAALTLDDYAIGRPDSFCYWIEFKTRDLGSVSGGSSHKWGVFWSKSDQTWKWNKVLKSATAEEALEKLKTGLINLIQAATQDRFDQLDQIGSKHLGLQRNALRAKPLSLYFPDKFLPISNPYHLQHFLTCLGQKPQGGLHSKNRQLLNFLRAQPELAGMDTHEMMAFLYSALPPGSPKTPSTPAIDSPDTPPELPQEIVQLATLAETTRNLILYGPPGTGKTYAVKRFAQFYLSEQLSTPVPLEQRRRDLIRPLTWHDVIALSMYLKRPHQRRFKVPEIAEDPLVKDFWSLTQTKKLNNQIWAMLQIHTAPDVETVKYKNRQPPYLFEKTDQSEWFLTEGGESYVEVKLADVRDDLVAPDESPPDIADYLRFVTFHQSFSYEEFIEGLKPITTEEGQIHYQVEDGIFKQLCRQAQNDPDHEYLLIIDEINRANIAKVFGELITLIEDDKRLEEDHEITVQLPYSKDTFGVPKNLLILGTMNTADRSIALLDIALRRRFTFIEQMPDPTLLSSVADVDLRQLLTKLNCRIVALLGRDYQIGHSYLMGVDSPEALHFAWYRQIIPLLQEYFYNDWERLKAIVGVGFVRPLAVDESTQQALGDLYDADSHYEVLVHQANSSNFLDSLRQITE